VSHFPNTIGCWQDGVLDRGIGIVVLIADFITTVIVRPLTTAMGRGGDEIDPQRGNPDQALETQLRQESIKRLLKKVEGFYNLCKR
jgi:hypothetical protein